MSLFVLSIALAAFGQTLPSTQPAAATSPRKQSMLNLRSLMQGVMIYANENRGFAPADLQHLGKMLGNGQDEATPAALLTNPQRPELKAEGYIYIVPMNARLQKMTQHQTKLAAYEAGDFGDGVNVAFWDGHVEFVSKPEQFKKLLDTAEAAAKQASP